MITPLSHLSRLLTLPREQKKQSLIEILHTLPPSQDAVRNDMEQVISYCEPDSHEVLDTLIGMIDELIVSIEQDNLAHQQDQINHIQSYLSRLQVQEQAERSQEEHDADMLLETL